MELHTIANRILGFGQCSLAKYLLVVAGEDDPDLDIDNIPNFFKHLLERIDLENDLHFQTRTTMDTLDYSGEGLNQGSKLFIAACGKKKRVLKSDTSSILLPGPFSGTKCQIPGVLLVGGPPFEASQSTRLFESLSQALLDQVEGFPMVVLLDDISFASESLANFLWVTFTRSNPSHDIFGVEERTNQKHFSPGKAMIIDARIKPHHAPPLEVPSETVNLASEILERAIKGI
jgi:4-hydroxy-3-polyprenylbenzoate decarboxylase